MERYLFVRPLLKRLGESRFLFRMVAVTLKVVAALIVLLSLTTFFKAGKLTFELPTNRILGGVLFELLFVIAVYVVVHVLLIRARDIENLEPSGYHALPLAPVLFRTLGEAYAGFVISIGVGGGLFVWFTDLSLNSVLSPAIRDVMPTISASTFLGGIMFMLNGILAGIAALVAAYIAADAAAQLMRAGRTVGVVRASKGEGYKSRFGS